jgi:hypothetical protein
MLTARVLGIYEHRAAEDNLLYILKHPSERPPIQAMMSIAGLLNLLWRSVAKGGYLTGGLAVPSILA